MAHAAVAAGAELWQGCTVDETLLEDGRAVGIRGRTQAGTPVIARAPIVIGADGQHSLVARMVGARSYHEVPALTRGYFSDCSGPITEGLEVHLLPHPIGVLAF